MFWSRGEGFRVQPDGDASRAYAQLADAVIRELDALWAVRVPDLEGFRILVLYTLEHRKRTLAKRAILGAYVGCVRWVRTLGAYVGCVTRHSPCQTCGMGAVK